MTGASSGIGLALCKLLVRDHGCHVYLGARNATKGGACLKDILAEVPAAAGKIELLAIDVTDEASVAAAAASLKAKGVTLYGLVNNAGVGLAQPGAPNGPEAILATNLYGVKRVSEAMLTLLDPSEGRIVNTSSGAASGFVKTQDAALKALLSGEGLTMETLEASIKVSHAVVVWLAAYYYLIAITYCLLLTTYCVLLQGVRGQRQRGVRQWVRHLQGGPERLHDHPGPAVPRPHGGQYQPWVHRHPDDAGLWRTAHTGAGLRVCAQMPLRTGHLGLLLWLRWGARS